MVGLIKQQGNHMLVRNHGRSNAEVYLSIGSLSIVVKKRESSTS